MNIKRIIVLGATVGAIAVSVSSCSGTNHDSGNPTTDIVIPWWRVETPPSVVTEFFGCFGTTGLLLDQGDGNIANTPNDPMCPKDGTPYQLVQRHGQDPAVIVGTYRLVPPDSTGKYQSVNGKV